jgi:endoplasmic reticulum Man9GlcNAc2 1,2-alpha-mannosidase
MYKDKPYTYGARRPRRMWRQKRVLFGGVVFLLVLIYWTGIFGSESGMNLEEGKKSVMSMLKGGDGNTVDWEARRERVKEAFMLSWDGYEQYAWGECHKFFCRTTKAFSVLASIYRRS